MAISLLCPRRHPRCSSVPGRRGKLDVPAVQWVADHEIVEGIGTADAPPEEEDEPIAGVADDPAPRLGEEGEGGVGGSLEGARGGGRAVRRLDGVEAVGVDEP
nr:unnamed protein product [Digitaria exilis]